MTHFANRSFWIDEYGDYIANNPLKNDISVDVAIVGGGFTGLSTAYNLRQQDSAARIVVLEGEIVGFGSSGRNAGWVIPQFGVDPYMVPAIYGKEKAKQAAHYCEQGMNYLDTMVRRHKMDCDYRKTGLMKVALAEKYIPTLEKFQKLCEEIGHGEQIKYLDKTAIRNEFDSPMIEAAIYESNIAVIQPCKLVREWKRIAESAGAEVYENTPAVSVDRGANKVVIKTPRGTVTAEKVVLATNAYSHLLGGDVGKKVKRDQKPLFPMMHITEKLTPEQWAAAVSKTYQCPIETTFSLYHGYTPTKDGRLILFYFRNISAAHGAAMRPYDYDVENRKLCQRHFETIFPSLKGVRIEQTWGGAISMTVDMVPHLGYVGDKNVILSTGCAGHGVCTSQINGLTISEMLLGKDTERTDLWFIRRKPWKWPVAPLGSIGIRSLVVYMELEDRLARRKTPLQGVREN